MPKKTIVTHCYFNNIMLNNRSIYATISEIQHHLIKIIIPFYTATCMTQHSISTSFGHCKRDSPVRTVHRKTWGSNEVYQAFDRCHVNAMSIQLGTFAGLSSQ